MIGGDSMDKDKELELLMDIQEKVGRIDERLKKVEATELKADEANRRGEKLETLLADLTLRVENLEQDKKYYRNTAVGAFISAAVAILSWLRPPF